MKFEEFCKITITKYFFGFLFVGSFSTAGATEKLCTSVRYSGPANEMPFGQYHRVHPSGNFVLYSAGQGVLVDLTDWSAPKSSVTDANDELYPVEGSWKFIASPNHGDGMRYYYFNDPKLGLLQKKEKVKAAFNDIYHNEIYHSAAELSHTHSSIKFRTLLFSAMKARDYTVTLDSAGHVSKVKKSSTYTLCRNLKRDTEKTMKEFSPEEYEIHKQVKRRVQSLMAISDRAWNRMIESCERSRSDCQTLKKQSDRIWEEIDRRAGSQERFLIFKKVQDEIDLAKQSKDDPQIETPILSKDGSEVAGIYDGTTRIFKIEPNGKCTEVLDLGFRASKVSFSYPVNGKSRFLSFTGSADLRPGASRPAGLIDNQAYIYDRNTKSLQLISDDPEARVQGYTGFTEDGRVLYPVMYKGNQVFAEVKLSSDNCQRQGEVPEQDSSGTTR